MSSLTFREIHYDSAEYHAECELRQEVLRRPLGLNLYDQNLSVEAEQRHFGLFEAETLLASIIVAPLSANEVKLRQMAVSPSVQGRGYGRKLLECVEEEWIQLGYTSASLHARISAKGFYTKLGFRAIGNEFEEVGIPHVQMVKSLI